MRKFTVFTVILAITVIVTVSEMFVNNYLPSLQSGEKKDLSLTLPESLDLSKIVKTDTFAADENSDVDPTLTNKLGSDVVKESTSTFVDETSPTPTPIAPVKSKPGELANLYDTDPTFTGSYDNAIPVPADQTGKSPVPTVPAVTANSSGKADDFEDPNYSASGVNVTLRQDQIESAGFYNAYIESEASDGKLFKTIDVLDLYDTQMQKFVIRSKEEMMAKAYIFSVGSSTKIDEVYQLIKSRCGQTPLVTINETNGFGSESFYMNDSSRSNTVFLTVRVGQAIYAFSYPKTYHQQVKNLLQLITWEID